MADLALKPSDAIHLFVSLACFAFGALILAVAPRTTPNRLFAAFTFLLGCNFFFGDVVPALTDPAPSERAFWDALARIALALDPIVLLLFVTRFPRRTDAVPDGLLWTLGGVASVLTLLVLVRPADFAEYKPSFGRLFLGGYMVTAYGAVLYVLARNLTREESPLKREQLGLMLIAAGTALIPRLPKVGVEIALYRELLPSGRNLLFQYTWLLFLALAVLITVFWYLEQRRREDSPYPVRPLAFTAAGVFVITYPWLLASGITPDSVDANALSAFIISTQFPLRWTIFLCVLGYALLKYQVFGADLRLKPTARTALVTLVAATALMGTYFLAQVMFLPVGRISFDVAPAVGVLVGIVVLGALLGRSTARPWTNPEKLHARRLDVYRNALEDTLAAGGDPGKDPRLHDLRTLLGVTEGEHAAMASVLTAPGRNGPRTPLQEGATVGGRYTVHRLLGRGKSGRTFLATDEVTKREVAVKEVIPAGEGIDAVVRELRAAARIRHPHVMQVHEVIPHGAGALLVMEYAPGGDLATHLARRSPTPPAEAARIAAQILDGLAAAHAAGLVHRDVKPANLLLDAEGRIKVSDFGVACAPGIEETRGAFEVGRMQPGTLRYMAPEQATGNAPVSPATDVYAVGIILYEAIAGRPYLELRGRGEMALRQAIATEMPALPLPGASAALNAVLQKALQKNPAARFPSAAAFRQALAACPEIAAR